MYYAPQLLIDECRAGMASLAARLVHCCVTSPPYWGLRDYGLPPVAWADGWSGCLGLEPEPAQFIAHLVEVFASVRRILRDDGVVFVNLGDSYADASKWGGYTGGRHPKGLQGATDVGRAKREFRGLKAGDLCNMPHRFAAAMQADGWYWRSTIIWHKRSPMPESLSGWRWRRHRIKTASWDNTAHPSGRTHIPALGVSVTEKRQASWSLCPGCDKCAASDGYILRRGKWRPTTAHEYVFMFSKSKGYFCDGDAVQEAVTGGAHQRGHGVNRKAMANGQVRGVKQNADWSSIVTELRETRNPRSVWSLSSEPYKGAHFATFPSLLAKRCIEAGTSSGGCCAACQAQLAPVIETDRVATRPGVDNKIWKAAQSGLADSITGTRRATSPNLDPKRHVAVTRVTGYRPTCDCGAGASVPCTVFDPFAGSGTTLQTAAALGRQAIGCELSEAYAALARERIAKLPRWALQASAERKTASIDSAQGRLFA